GISFSMVGNVVTLSGTSSLANYQAAIQAITFSNTTANPDTSVRNIEIVVTDGTSNSNTATASITLVPLLTMPETLSALNIGDNNAVITTAAAITQANLEAALGLPNGTLD